MHLSMPPPPPPPFPPGLVGPGGDLTLLVDNQMLMNYHKCSQDPLTYPREGGGGGGGGGLGVVGHVIDWCIMSH